jgi:hypothetical protein
MVAYSFVEQRASSPITRLEPGLCNYNRRQGGESSENLGQIRLVRAVLVGFSYKIHWRLGLFTVLPTTSTDWTTLYHFCPHLTPKAFIVNKEV